jgi:hypothetical protein
MDTKIGQWLLMGMLRQSAGGFLPRFPRARGQLSTQRKWRRRAPLRLKSATRPGGFLGEFKEHSGNHTEGAGPRMEEDRGSECTRTSAWPWEPLPAVLESSRRCPPFMSIEKSQWQRADRPYKGRKAR